MPAVVGVGCHRDFMPPPCVPLMGRNGESSNVSPTAAPEPRGLAARLSHLHLGREELGDRQRLQNRTGREGRQEARGNETMCGTWVLPRLVRESGLDQSYTGMD